MAMVLDVLAFLQELLDKALPFWAESTGCGLELNPVFPRGIWRLFVPFEVSFIEDFLL